MASPFDLTGNAINMILKLETEDAENAVTQFKRTIQGLEGVVDTLQQQMGSAMGRITSAVEDFSQQLLRSGAIATPAGGNPAAMENLNKLVEKLGKDIGVAMSGLNQDIRKTGDNVEGVNTSLQKGAGEATKLKTNLTGVKDVAEALKGALAFAGIAVGMGAMINSSTALDEKLRKLTVRLEGTGENYKSITEDTIGLARRTKETTSEILAMEQQLVGLQVADKETRNTIIETTSKLSRAFDGDKTKIASFFAAIHQQKLATDQDIRSLGDALAEAQKIKAGGLGPGDVNTDVANIQNRLGAIQQLRTYLRADTSNTEKDIQDATQRHMRQIVVASRVLARGGMDQSLIDRMLALPGELATKGGQMSAGLLTAFGGLGDILGKKINVDDLMKQIEHGHLDVLVGMIEEAAKKIDPKTLQIMPAETLKLIYGSLAPDNIKQFNAQLIELEKNGFKLSDVMKLSNEQLDKAAQIGGSLGAAWAKVMAGISGEWTKLTSNLSILQTRLDLVFGPSLQKALGFFNMIVEKLTAGLEWLNKYPAVLETIQHAVEVLVSFVAFGKLLSIVKQIYQYMVQAAGIKILLPTASPLPPVPVPGGPVPVPGGPIPVPGGAGGAAAGETAAAAGAAAVARAAKGAVTVPEVVASGVASMAGAEAQVQAGAAKVAAAGAQVAESAVAAEAAKTGILAQASKLMSKGTAVTGLVSAYQGYGAYQEAQAAGAGTGEATGKGVGAGAGSLLGSLLPFLLGISNPLTGAIVGLTGMLALMKGGGWLGSLLGGMFDKQPSPEEAAAAMAKGAASGSEEGVLKGAGPQGQKLAQAMADQAERDRVAGIPIGGKVGPPTRTEKGYQEFDAATAATQQHMSDMAMSVDARATAAAQSAATAQSAAAAAQTAPAPVQQPAQAPGAPAVAYPSPAFVSPPEPGSFGAGDQIPVQTPPMAPPPTIPPPPPVDNTELIAAIRQIGGDIVSAIGKSGMTNTGGSRADPGSTNYAQ